jgi:hypothetical protein
MTPGARAGRSGASATTPGPTRDFQSVSAIARVSQIERVDAAALDTARAADSGLQKSFTSHRDQQSQTDSDSRLPVAPPHSYSREHEKDEQPGCHVLPHKCAPVGDGPDDITPIIAQQSFRPSFFRRCARPKVAKLIRFATIQLTNKNGHLIVA